jgi:hypothetical protein
MYEDADGREDACRGHAWAFEVEHMGWTREALGVRGVT